MKKTIKEVSAVLLILASIAICGCNSSKETKKTKQLFESNLSDSVELESQEALKTDTSYDSPHMSVDDMEEGFIRYCEDNGIEYRFLDEDSTHRYELPGYLIVLTKYSDNQLAQNALKEVLDYGGWYEEDLVRKEVNIDGENTRLMAYYCQDDGGETMLFVLAYKENLFFHMEGIGSQQVKTVEEILKAMGIEMDS